MCVKTAAKATSVSGSIPSLSAADPDVYECFMARRSTRFSPLQWSGETLLEPAGECRSCHLAGRETQTREIQFALVAVPQVAHVRYQSRCDGPQPRDDIPCVIQPTHVSVAGSEISVWLRVTCIVLDRKEQRRHRRIKSPGKEIGATDYAECGSDASAGTKAQRSFTMADRSIGVAPTSKARRAKSMLFRTSAAGSSLRLA